MQKAYNRINWENYPSTETAVNATNLNLIDYGLNEVDNRVIELDITKANQTDLLNSVASVTFNSTTGILTVTLNNGTATQIDTGLAKLAVNFDYDEDPTSPHYQQLILQMKDGTYKYIDLSAMITQFEFDNTSTVAFTVNAQTGHISAIVPDGSITAEKLNPNVIVTMQAIEDAAEADALKSEGHAVGEQNGTPVGPGSPYYQNNASHYAEAAHTDATAIATQLSQLQYREVAVASSDWEVNYDPSSSTPYTYICRKTVADDVPDHPEWRMATSTPIPAGTDVDQIKFVIEAWFGTGAYYYSDASTSVATTSKTILLYATAQPTINLKLMYKGV